jgi:hypothetical protein
MGTIYRRMQLWRHGLAWHFWSLAKMGAAMTAIISESRPHWRNGTVGSVSGEPWRDELTLIGDMATVNRQISIYVVRALDADAGRDEPTAPAHEHALGAHLVGLGTELQTRAARRSTDVRDRIPREHPERHVATRNRPRETRTPWSNPSTAIYMSE